MKDPKDYTEQEKMAAQSFLAPMFGLPFMPVDVDEVSKERDRTKDRMESGGKNYNVTINNVQTNPSLSEVGTFAATIASIIYKFLKK